MQPTQCSEEAGGFLRVLLSAWACDPEGGTEGANAWFTAEGLAHAGADVHILTRSSNEAQTSAAIRELSLEGRGSITVSSLPDHLSGEKQLFGLGIYARYAVWQARCHRWASERFNGDWDVGHHISYGTLSLPVGLAGCGFPLVVGPVGGGQVLDPEHARWYDGDLKIERLRTLAVKSAAITARHARKVARGPTHILATNHESAELARRLGSKQVALALADGVRESQIGVAPVEYPTDPKIVWIGSFRPRQAASLAIMAFRLVMSSVPTARLVFIGDGPARGHVEASASDLVEAGRVRLLGRLPWREAQSELRSARVHLFTSVLYSFGAQTLEAAAAGIPSVAMDAFGARAFLHHPGFVLVNPRPGESLDARFAEALVEALCWPADRWHHEGRGAMRFASENRYRERAAGLLRLYEELIADG